MGAEAPVQERPARRGSWRPLATLRARLAGLDAPDGRLHWLRRDEGWDPAQDRRRVLAAFGVAIAASLLKFGVAQWFGGELGYLGFVAAVVVGSWVAGFRGGILTTVLCALAEATIFRGLTEDPLGTPNGLLRVCVFAFDGFLVSVVTSGLRRALNRERTARGRSESLLLAQRTASDVADRDRRALRALIDSIGEGVVVLGPDGRVSLANQTATAILGGALPTDLAELRRRVGLGPSDAAEDPDGTPPGDESTPAGSPQAAQLADGRWLETTISRADLGSPAADDPSSVIVVVRDVTRAKEAEAAREAFFGVLSHELRTPVTTIFGNAKVLRRPSRRDNAEELLSDIEVEAERLNRIVEDLLALSRVEGGISIDGEPLLIQHLVQPVVKSEAQRWPHVRFWAGMPPGLPAVLGERTYVEQVLRNLVSNAGKYGRPGSWVTVVAEATATEVEVRVRDTGIGIDAETADRLFELYYRAPSSARSVTGSGIGLYVSRGLVTAMGGRIWAQPRAGGGSEFGFSLPRCEVDLDPQAVAEEVAT